MLLFLFYIAKSFCCVLLLRVALVVSPVGPSTTARVALARVALTPNRGHSRFVSRSEMILKCIVAVRDLPAVGGGVAFMWKQKTLAAQLQVSSFARSIDVCFTRLPLVGDDWDCA
jgi:hypothetical protein